MHNTDKTFAGLLCKGPDAFTGVIRRNILLSKYMKNFATFRSNHKMALNFFSAKVEGVTDILCSSVYVKLCNV